MPYSGKTKKRETDSKGESVSRYHLAFARTRAFLRCKGRAPTRLMISARRLESDLRGIAVPIGLSATNRSLC